MTSRISSFSSSIVIQKYCEGKTLDKIAEETNLSKGTVYNLVKRWKDSLGNSGIEEIREFASIVRKSGTTIRECALGFRIIQILKEFGINDEFEENNESGPERDLLAVIRNETYCSDRRKNDFDFGKSLDVGLTKKRNKDTITKNGLYFFIEDMYNNCKKYDIKPSNIIRWLKDLFNFYPTLQCELLSDNNSEPDLPLFTDTENESANPIYLGRAPFRQHDDDIQKNFKGKGDTSIKQNNEKNISINILFTSQVSYYIEQIKLEYKALEKHRKSLYNEISVIENRKLILESNLKETIEKNNDTLAHLKWYDFLKQHLSDNYNMNLDEEIVFFSSIINDFKTFNYNILDMLKEYKQIQSLRKERDHILNDINLNAPLQQSLLKEVGLLNSKLDVSRQTMKIYGELIAMGFDLKKLKQLYCTITEISIVNHLPVLDAVTKFLNDIEDQYDSKLGFETKIKELKSTVDKLKDEIPNYKFNIQFQYYISDLLSYLLNTGITIQDIVNMSHLVVSLQNSNFLAAETGAQRGSTIGDTRGSNNSNKIDKNECWRLFIDKLRSIKSLDSEIEKLTVLHGDLSTDIALLNASKKNEFEESY
jgi:hypothetical protein